jgi:hypothetical protein
VTDRTATNPDDYTGTDHIEGILDQWGFDVVETWIEPWPRIVVRPRDPRLKHMAKMLEKWIAGIGVHPGHFSVVVYDYLIGQADTIILVGVDDRRVMLDRQAAKNAARWARWEELCGPHFGDGDKLQAAMEWAKLEDMVGGE